MLTSKFRYVCFHFPQIMTLFSCVVLEDESLINWSNELESQYGSCLYPLWNRAAGDCLLDSVLQATWGVFDRDNMLRKKLYEALAEGYHKYVYKRFQVLFLFQVLMFHRKRSAFQNV